MAYQPTAEEKQMGMLSHLLCLLTGWIGPLIIMLTKGSQSPFVKLHSKQALVWSLSIIVAYIAAMVVAFVLVFIPVLGPILSCLIYLALVAAHATFTIMGAVKVNKGEKFVYPVVAQMFCKDGIAAIYGDDVMPAAAAPQQTPPPPAAPSA